MKNILIIADGILAKHFLEKVMNLKANDNKYTFLAYKKKTLPKNISKKIPLHFFDPTSLTKLSRLIEENKFYQIMVVLEKKADAVATYENIRKIDKDIIISIIDKWAFDNYEDANLESLHARDVLVSRFADFLPDMPVTAQNVGLGNGEIMEVQVPVGSSYLYRHLSSIEQKDWRIVALYRNNKLLLARPTLMIRPSDVLLIIGEPQVLLNVYKSVKQELGQFPYPFGNNIYCLIDMKTMNGIQINTIINDALLLHSNLNNKFLHIRVINPTFSKTFEKIKNYESNHIKVSVNYHLSSPDKVLQNDVSKLDVGLIVTNNSFFKEYKKILYKQKLPIFKIGIWGFSSIESGVILASSGHEIERESSVILDFCSQLDLEITLYDFDPNGENSTKSLIDHFENLSKLFDKDVEILNSNEKNPLITLKSRKDFIQFVPFQQEIIKKSFKDIFSTNMNKLSHKLEYNYQLFIPVV